MAQTYVPYTQIPVVAIQDIKDIVVNDEGGWVLTENKDDPDGGFTYAGVIASHWGDYYSHLRPETPYTDNNVLNWLSLLDEDTKKTMAIEIYYAEFYLPLQEMLGLTEELHPYELSCGINCGNHTVALIKKLADIVTVSSYETIFLREWMRHYILLVQSNSAAWRTYALALEAKKPALKPVVLRSVDLNGWFNRVERYRSESVAEEVSGLVS